MKKSIFLIILILSNVVTSQTKDKRISDKLFNIENGIAEFSSPESIVYPDKYDSPQKKTVIERMTTYKVPGVSIAVFNNDTLYTLTYGYLKEGSDAKVTEKTIFQAASTSKLITSVIVLHYAEKGILDLDADVNTYLKRWKVPVNQLTTTKKVTLRLLLTNMSGLPSTNFPLADCSRIPSLIDVIKGSYGNKPAIPVSEPGGKWQYSNIGFVLIQLILEDITMKPFAEIADEIVFKPLGMKSSTFIYPLEKEWRDCEALPHGEDGKYAAPRMHPSALAHGGLMTTPEDLALFTMEIIKACAGRSSELIGREYADKLMTKEIDLDPALFGFPVGQGLGVMLIEKAENTLFTLPGSNLPGTNCWLIASSKTGKGAIVMTNGALGELLGIEIITAISKEFDW